MLTLEEAKTLAVQALAKMSGRSPDEYAFLDKLVRCKRYGWVLIYNSRKYIETGDFLEAFGGNGPVVVMHDGTLHHLGTANTVDGSIAAFEQEHGL